MELWDALDAGGQALGFTVGRGDPLPPGVFHRVVEVWVFDSPGRCILSRRHPDKTWPHFWECTGGSVLAGEDSRSASLREVREEIGLELDPSGGVQAGQYLEDDSIFDVWLYRANVDLRTLVMQEGEVVDIRLASPSDIRTLLARGEMIPKLSYVLDWNAFPGGPARLPRDLEDFVQTIPGPVVGVLNGSRVDANAPVDFLQDWDLALYVEDPFLPDLRKEDPAWMQQFGSLVMFQQNDFPGGYIFLMQYASGLRIDLSVHEFARLDQSLRDDSLSLVVHDPDRRVRLLPVPSDTSHRSVPPDRTRWDAVWNEVFWLQAPIARELWRGNHDLARQYRHVYQQKALLEIASWHCGARHAWGVNTGKGGKWLRRYMDSGVYALWTDFQESDMRSGLGKLAHLADVLGRDLERALGYPWPGDMAGRVAAYVEKLCALEGGEQGFSLVPPGSGAYVENP